MRLEFEPNASALPFVENEVVNQKAASEAEKMLREGVKAAQEGKRAEARNLLLRVTEADADNENAWLWLASISEYPEELLVFLNNVLRINPQNERALEWHKATKSLLAKTLVQRGIDALGDNRKDFARQCFEQAIEHEAENEMAWLWMASVSDSEEEKIVCFEKVLIANPNNETAKTSLNSIQSQKTQKLFQNALSAAFDGNHSAAQEMLETVLNRDSEMEDAWVLKSHIADSFEERAECFLKIRALNPENEMANANLASWRMLADKLGERAKTEELPAASDEDEKAAAADFSEEPADYSSEDTAAETAGVEASNEAAGEIKAAEEFSTEFSIYPPAESFVEDRSEPAAEDFSAETEAKNEVLEFGAAEPEILEMSDDVDSGAASLTETDLDTNEFSNLYTDEFSNSELYTHEFSNSDGPTQELSLPSVAEQSFAAPAEQEPAQNQFDEANPAESEAAFEEFHNEEFRFESEESRETYEEFSEPQPEIAEETAAEEAKMNWAFGELEQDKEVEDFFQHLDDSDDIHKTHPANIHETQFSNYEAEDYSFIPASAEHPEPAEDAMAELSAETAAEVKAEEWRDTSPNVFTNYSPEMPENSFEAGAVEFSFGKFEAEAIDMSFEEVKPVEENPAEFSYLEEIAEAPEIFTDNTEESAVAEEAAAVVEEPAMTEVFEAQVIETPDEEPVLVEAEEVLVNTEETIHPQLPEEFPHSKAEMVLCPFCNTENEKQAFSCVSCQTVLTLSDLEMLLGQQNADLEKLQQAVASLESENESYGLNAEQLTSLGIGQVNLKNYRQGFFYLQEAVRMNPSNVILDAQVNALAIRLSEIEEQQSAYDSMPKNRKILVVDDSPTVRKLISGKLEKCGHEVICAVDGVDALEKINELTPDLILLDITMPRMDGYQVCKLIRSNEATKDVPVVMISGKDGFFDKVRGRMAGTTGYITKPFGPETLMKTVETYLN